MPGLSRIVMGLSVLILWIGIIILIVFGETYNIPHYQYPLELDVVLVDTGRGRTTLQVARIQKFMPWVRSIIVLHSTPTPDPVLPDVRYVAFSGEVAEALQSLKTFHPDVADAFFYLGDVSVPNTHVSKRDLWSTRSSKKRMFNNLEFDTRTTTFIDLYESTIPSLVYDTDDLAEATSLRHYIWTLSLTDEVVYTPFINHLVMLSHNPYANALQTDHVDDANLFTSVLLPKLDPDLNALALTTFNTFIA